jgi:hypothetical protein
VYWASISFTSFSAERMISSFCSGTRMSPMANRQAGARRQAETRLQQAVGEDHRLAQAAAAERGVDQAADLLFLQRLVDQRERQSGRQNLRQDGTADGGFVARDAFAARAGLAIDVSFTDADGHARL